MKASIGWSDVRFPKGTDFSKITDEQGATVKSIINNSSRKCVGYHTPLEVA